MSQYSTVPLPVWKRALDLKIIVLTMPALCLQLVDVLKARGRASAPSRSAVLGLPLHASAADLK